MSAASRAEARRKAILSRGNDRLAKLTTSARGEDAPAFVHDDPPLPPTGTSKFLGEDSDMPTPPARNSPSPGRAALSSVPVNPFAALLGSGEAPDPAVWSQEQQMQFMQALMGPPEGTPSTQGLPPMDDNPFAALLASRANMQQGPGIGKAPASPPAPKTRLQKLMPLVHMLAVWVLLAFFVIYHEPRIHEASGGLLSEGSLWQRWAELATKNPLSDIMKSSGWKIEAVPFFWAFVTIQLGLHSLRIFSGLDPVRLPTLLAIALPHIPPPFPTIITTSFKYLQMGSLFMDDIAAAIVGIGFFIWLAGWLSS